MSATITTTTTTIVEEKKEETVFDNNNDNDVAKARKAFTEKVFEAVLGAQMVQTAYLGYKLGWYDTLAKAGDKGMTPQELANATQSSQRYAREWLEQQTVSGWMQCENPTENGADKRRFVLPPSHAGVMTDKLALDYLMPLAVIQAGWGKDIDKLLHAYKYDTGLSWEDMTHDAREQQAAMNRPFFLNGLGQILEDSLDEDTLKKLKTSGGKVADIGAGYAWSSIGVAHHFPAATVDAFDLHQPSVEQAHKNVATEDLQDRVKVQCIDASTLVTTDNNTPSSYDLVMALECIHDMNDPISVLKTMRLLTRDSGTVIVMDERVAETFAEAAKTHDAVEQAMYGFSCMCCLADGKSRPNSVATGTVMRPGIFQMYAQQAGFRDIEILPAENDFFRFYKLIK